MLEVDLRFLLCATILLFAGADSAQVAGKVPPRALDAAVADLLRKAAVPGGIEVVRDCGQFESKQFEIASGPIGDALASLSQSESRLTWRKIGGSYSVTINSAGVSVLASVEVPALKLRVRTLAEASDTLLQQKAVRQRIADLRLSEAPDNLGFSSLNEQRARDISLPAATFRDDLDAVAAAFGAAIWELDQRQCGDNRTFRLSWISK